MTSENTYEMTSAGGLHCFACGGKDHGSFEAELRHCVRCDIWHVPHLKPSWAKDDMHEAIVEAAMEWQHDVQGSRYGPNAAMVSKRLEELEQACAALAAERGG